MHARLRPIARRLFGSRCLLCAGAADAALCEECAAEMPRLQDPVCAGCGLPSPGGSPCGACSRHPPPWRRMLAACAYGHPADALVKALKYGGRLECAPALAQLLAGALATHPPPDVIAPVPLSPARLRDRGFNQCLEIARALPATFATRADGDALVRVGDTGPQAALPLAQRAENVRGAFRAGRSLDGLRVAILDDVMTTGATLREAAAAARQAGAAGLEVWVVARAL